jgi:prepilin-type N-terminal cleavage/methylation domain-containing protein
VRVVPDDGRERGFTVIELSIVLAISGLLMASLLGMLTSQTNAERRVTALAGNQEQVRLALVEIQQDLRSAEPLVPLTDASKYPQMMEIVHVGFDDDVVTHLRWRLDATAHELVREVLDGNGAVARTTFRLRGVTGNTVFRYFDANGNELLPAGLADVANCSIRVRVKIEAAPQPGPQPLDNWSDVQLRNRLPGNQECLLAGTTRGAR